MKNKVLNFEIVELNIAELLCIISPFGDTVLQRNPETIIARRLVAGAWQPALKI